MFRFLAIRSTAERIDIQDHLAARLDIQAHVIQRLLVSAGVPSFCQMESHPNAVNWNIPVPVVLHMPITLECRQLECLSHRSDLSCKRQGDVLSCHFSFEFQPSCCTHLVQASRGSVVYPKICMETSETPLHTPRMGLHALCQPRFMWVESLRLQLLVTSYKICGGRQRSQQCSEATQMLKVSVVNIFSQWPQLPEIGTPGIFPSWVPDMMA